VILAPLLFALIMLALALIFGRFFCGWVCPMGTVIDWTGSLRGRRTVVSGRARNIKYYILGIVFILAILGIQTAWTVDPLVIMTRAVSLYAQGGISFLFGERTQNFDHAVWFPVILAFILAAALVIPRLWCRMLCPLGALYALAGRFSLLKRIAPNCAECEGSCDMCRMGAITSPKEYIREECILCMDCVYDCVSGDVRFVWPSFYPERSAEKPGISRKGFLFLLSAAFFGAGFKKISGSIRGDHNGAIRPPGAEPEQKFLAQCIRCGDCMRVCPTNGLQPSFMETGPGGIWTPRLVPEIGYCQYDCALCGSVCPTGAIRKLSIEEKKNTRIGTAEIDRSKCFAWAHETECGICEKYCPVIKNAIELEKTAVNGRIIPRPHVNISRCIGCGICQSKCPARPVRAIKVTPSKTGAV